MSSQSLLSYIFFMGPFYHAKEQAIKEFVNLQRLKTAENKEKEIAYQERVLKTRLQALGIPTEELEIK